MMYAQRVSFSNLEYSQRQSQIAMEFATIAQSQDDPIVGEYLCDGGPVIFSGSSVLTPLDLLPTDRPRP